MTTTSRSLKEPALKRSSTTHDVAEQHENKIDAKATLLKHIQTNHSEAKVSQTHLRTLRGKKDKFRGIQHLRTLKQRQEKMNSRHGTNNWHANYAELGDTRASTLLSTHRHTDN